MPSHFYIGTSGWIYPHWTDQFYPSDLPKNQWLNFYASQFNAVELNATFYRSFPKKTFQHWSETVPNHFRYVIKASRFITHRKYLLNVTDPIKRFERPIVGLKENFGLILLQLPPNMPYDLVRLENALKAFHFRNQVAVEFRNARWFTPETRDLLTSLDVILCDVDSPNLSFQKWRTSDIGYIRLHGRNDWYASNYTPKELKEIAQYARSLIKRGAKQVYIFL